MDLFHKTLENTCGNVQRGYTDVSCRLVSLTLIPSHILDLHNYQWAFWHISAWQRLFSGRKAWKRWIKWKNTSGDGAKKHYLRIQNMSHQSETLPSLPPSSAVPSVQVWVKEWSKRGWLSSRKWCGSSWRVPCRRSWRNCWTPAQAPRKRYTNTLPLSPSPCCSETIWLWFGVRLRHSITEWKQHQTYTFGFLLWAYVTRMQWVRLLCNHLNELLF